MVMQSRAPASPSPILCRSSMLLLGIDWPLRDKPEKVTNTSITTEYILSASHIHSLQNQIKNPMEMDMYKTKKRTVDYGIRP